MTNRTCTEPNCDRPHSAHGLCGSHYNQRHHPERHTKKATPCAVCGTVVMKYPSGAARRPVCSPDCRYVLQYGYTKANRTALVGPVPKVPVARVTEPPMVRVPSTRKGFIQGECRWCGKCITHDLRITGVRIIYCSRPCSRKAGKVLRRARERGAPGVFTLAEVVKVWLALGRVCAYCATPGTDSLPEPDHVLALSRGGSNSITNIVPCCRGCNVDKSDMTLDEWSHWRAVRGKPTLTIRLDRPELAYLVVSRATIPSKIIRDEFAAA